MCQGAGVVAVLAACAAWAGGLRCRAETSVPDVGRVVTTPHPSALATTFDLDTQPSSPRYPGVHCHVPSAAKTSPSSSWVRGVPAGVAGICQLGKA